jgi:hypothetical protein
MPNPVIVKQYFVRRTYFGKPHNDRTIRCRGDGRTNLSGIVDKIPQRTARVLRDAEVIGVLITVLETFAPGLARGFSPERFRGYSLDASSDVHNLKGRVPRA